MDYSIRGSNFGVAFRGRTSRLGIMAQFVNPTPEMRTGFATNNAYDDALFRMERAAGGIVTITSLDTGIQYGLQIKPVFDGELDSVGLHRTSATIVEVNGRRLQSLQNAPVTLTNDGGWIRVDIRR